MSRRPSPARVLVPLLLIGTGLVGCSSSPSDVEATPTPTSVEAVSYGTVQEFADALEAAGADCRFEQTNAVTNAAESGSCGSSLTLMTFTGAESRDASIEDLKSFGSVIGTYLLVGPNWVLNGEGSAEYKDALGGTVVTVDPEN